MKILIDFLIYFKLLFYNGIMNILYFDIGKPYLFIWIIILPDIIKKKTKKTKI